MIRAVLDTNVFISALFWKGAPHEVLQSGFRGAFSIVISEEILLEVQTKLLHKFKFPPEDTRAFIEVVTINSEIVDPKKKLMVVTADLTDNKIIECADAGNVDFIVTGDLHLLRLRRYERIEIVKPSEFLKKI